MNGKLQFSLPGKPLFPDLGDDTVLKPAFNWLLQSDKPGKFDAEVGYVTGGFEWSASYNLVSPEKGDFVDLVGWITMNNQSGKTFENAKIKLMAGDVNKIQPQPAGCHECVRCSMAMAVHAAPAVTEKAFDEFHLYSVARPTTLHDHETKQVEFVHAEKMFAPTIYVYDGAPDYRILRRTELRPGLRPDATTRKSSSSASSKTPRRTSSALRCRRASCASTAAMTTASCNSSARTRLTTRRETKKSA